MPAKVFISYSHKDQRLRDELETHLSIMKNSREIESWHDRRITAGEEWADKIDENLRAADLILLLVSADFLASRYCFDVELTLAMQRHERSEAVVIPIILKPVDWKGAPFSKLQALPTEGRPITKWSNRDEAFTVVSKSIRETVRSLAPRDPNTVMDLPPGPKPPPDPEPGSVLVHRQSQSWEASARQLRHPRTPWKTQMARHGTIPPSTSLRLRKRAAAPSSTSRGH
ncbi:MAG: toll/interleukin-1 receptor domain-containing protein [Cyanobium sp.]